MSEQWWLFRDINIAIHGYGSREEAELFQSFISSKSLFVVQLSLCPDDDLFESAEYEIFENLTEYLEMDIDARMLLVLDLINLKIRGKSRKEPNMQIDFTQSELDILRKALQVLREQEVRIERLKRTVHTPQKHQEWLERQERLRTIHLCLRKLNRKEKADV